jgi:serine/threonine-protein kinase
MAVRFNRIDSCIPDAVSCIMSGMTDKMIRLPDTDKTLPRHMVVGFMHYTNFKDFKEGGVARLELCYDKNLCRNVVMKRLHPHLRDNQMEQARFLREARVTAQIQHPTSVPVYELGRDDKGDPYFTMKKLEGRDLRDIIHALLDGDPMTVEDYPLIRLLDIFIQVCQGIAYAHHHGVIHRDLKPANILIGEFFEVMILDWGLAKVFSEPEEADYFVTKNRSGTLESPELTQAGRRYGTPLYMSPEQAEGITAVDERCDIYNLGSMLYEMLTLQNLITGDDINEVMHKVRVELPIPPSVRAPHLDVPPEVEAICLKALQKDPADRYTSVLEMSDAVQHYLDRTAHE